MGAARGVGAADEQDPVLLIAARLRQSRLSVRELARRAGVSHSAVSRLLGRRARPTAGLLCALGPPLDLPPDLLLSGVRRPAGRPPVAPAAGEAAEGGPRTPAGADTWAALRAIGLDPAPAALVERIQERLGHLREFAATAEGRMQAREGLGRKVAALGARGPVIDRLLALGRLYLEDGPAPPAARHAAGSAVLYFLLAVDAIDDFVWPIGYLDDALAVVLAEADVRRALAASAPGPASPTTAAPS